MKVPSHYRSWRVIDLYCRILPLNMEEIKKSIAEHMLDMLEKIMTGVLLVNLVDQQS